MELRGNADAAAGRAGRRDQRRRRQFPPGAGIADSRRKQHRRARAKALAAARGRDRQLGHRGQVAEKIRQVEARDLGLQIGDRILRDEPGRHQVRARRRVGDLVAKNPGQRQGAQIADVKVAQPLAEKDRRHRRAGRAGADLRRPGAADLAADPKGQQKLARLVDDGEIFQRHVVVLPAIGGAAARQVEPGPALVDDDAEAFGDGFCIGDRQVVDAGRRPDLAAAQRQVELVDVELVAGRDLRQHQRRRKQPVAGGAIGQGAARGEREERGGNRERGEGPQVHSPTIAQGPALSSAPKECA